MSAAVWEVLSRLCHRVPGVVPSLLVQRALPVAFRSANQQHDAVEYLEALLADLPRGAGPTSPGWRGEEARAALAGTVEQRVACGNCRGRTTYREEQVCLHVACDGDTPVQGLVDAAAREGDLNGYHCERCGEVPARIRHRYAAPGPAVLLVVARGAGDGTRRGVHASGASDELRLPCGGGGGLGYRLFCVIAHMGSAREGGHYVAAGRDSRCTGAGAGCRWELHDDSRVTRTASLQEALAEAGPGAEVKALLYVRRGVGGDEGDAAAAGGGGDECCGWCADEAARGAGVRTDRLAEAGEVVGRHPRATQPLPSRTVGVVAA